MSKRPPVFADLFPNFDASAQYQTVQSIIEIVGTARNDIHGRISEARQDLAKADDYPEDAVAEATLHDLYFESIYSDAGAVQTAVSMLAPMAEGFLVHAFEYLRVLHGDSSAPTAHRRWNRAQEQFWNPRNGGGLIDNLKELQAALNLESWLTDERLETLELLFFFRNKSLHYAFDWPAEEMARFEKYVSQQEWEKWVDYARSDGEAWVAYLKDEFISRALNTIRELLTGFASVAKDRGGQFIFFAPRQ